MLSITNISAGQASHYYEKDDYYAKDSPEHKEASKWFGKGATTLGLNGQVEKDAFVAMLQGKLPTGQQLGRIVEGKIDHAAGLDMTFSAPKSVSILSEIKGDTRLIAAHNKAVISALEYAERHFVNTRIKIDGEIFKKKVDNLTVAMFQHNTSRAHDPQLHTHCVIMNAVQKSDGDWRSAELKGVFDNKIKLGQIYRSELAAELQKLGYSIRLTGKGLFEIDGISDSVLKHFSKRSVAKEEALKDYDYVNAKTAENAVLMTRESKQVLSKEVLQTRWLNECKAIGFDIANAPSSDKPSLSVFDRLKQEFHSFCQKFGLKAKAQASVAEQAVQYAVAHLSERSAAFEGKDLQIVALQASLGETTISIIDAEIKKWIDDGRLLPSSKQDGIFTTKEALQKEKDTIELSHGEKRQVYTQEQCKKLLTETSLSKGQKDAVSLILSGKDRIACIQGYAGTGKTFMLDTARKFIEEKGYNFIGLAPSSSAAVTLRTQAKIQSQTLHKFLFRYKGLLEGRGTIEGRRTMQFELKNKIIVLDEASLAATSHMHSLMKISKELDVKVMLIGDVKQLGAVEAGKPFYQLQEAGIKTAIMDDIKRQTNPKLHAAVQDTIKAVDSLVAHQFITKAIEKIGDNYIECERKNFAKAAAIEWLKFKGDALITVPSRQLRVEINMHIREKLQDQQILKGRSEIFSILDNKNSTIAEKTLAKNYFSGEQVLFNKTYLSLGISKGQYCTVIKSQKHNIVQIQTEFGRKVLWNPQKMSRVEVFEQRYIQVQQGEQIRWTKNFGDINNSDTAKVLNVTDKHIILQLQTGHTKTFSKTDPILKHMDYAYASTVHAAQGKTAKYVIGVLESEHKHLTNQRSFYVTLSRARESAILISDNKSGLISTLAEHRGIKESAIAHQTRIRI